MGVARADKVASPAAEIINAVVRIQCEVFIVWFPFSIVRSFILSRIAKFSRADRGSISIGMGGDAARQ